ncbi:hypothetical protein SISNIDRAFT_457831 [Sistotremastrum niveocremeum HHB9708]|uniref:BTB domain-containing protein n=1 Tax=Sistotremastrum niveocremeum HHB9708 TaxID=1314777 RepID=A0A164R6W9_9AGAM|nr:hypothetical protein SISNIDRAFT_457831 [Sistotremastrum niveocremeum HHB9708]
MSPASLGSLQSHLYLSFLNGSTADVALHVSGTWDAVYYLHRVVLIQAGFFQSLFTSGFLESGGPSSSSPKEVKVRFPDSNITRPAFEICIARLYGGGPPLFAPPAFIPTHSVPLTPGLSMSNPYAKIPPGHQLASPRFLLSLLATSIYLSIPSTTSHAMSLILNSVGPRTVIRYLNFAIGQGMGSPDEDEPQSSSATGLEQVARHVVDKAESVNESYSLLDESNVELEDATEDEQAQKIDPAESHSFDEHEHGIHYGLLSDKIGEACASWLARWGTDMLEYEEEDQAGWRPYDTNVIRAAERHRSNFPRIWRRGGLSAAWVRALLSSDEFWIRGEWERYQVARRIVELRRKEGVLEEEEREWRSLFDSAIYYCHLPLEQLVSLSSDISPSTKDPYVPLSTIQAAHWTQSLLRHHIMTGSSASQNLPPASPGSRDKDLGIGILSASILSGITSGDIPKDRPYWLVPSDASRRIGESTPATNNTSSLSTSMSMDQLFQRTLSSGPKTIQHPITSEANFFGIHTPSYDAESCVAMDASGASRWSPYPPFRFGAEFWDVESLKEKTRLHSHTVWYAGNLFNVYVQVVRKKGVQLGIYLHRQSSVDPIPPASAPAPLLSPRNERGPSPVRAPSIPISTSAPRFGSPPLSSPLPLSPRLLTQTISLPVAGTPSPRSSTPGGTPVTSSYITAQNAWSIPALAPVHAPLQPFRDPRSTIAAFFAISCPSGTGSSLTRFSSAPDSFPIGQSWGWKSSTLRSEEYLETADGHGAPREVSLRATIILGLV